MTVGEKLAMGLDLVAHHEVKCDKTEERVSRESRVVPAHHVFNIVLVKAAQRACWRRGVAEASADNKKIWNLERWARLRSHTRPDPVTLPPLSQAEGEPPTARTHKEKAAMLAV